MKKNKCIGVSFCKRNGKWDTRIVVDKKAIFLGYYGTYEEAVVARLRKCAEIADSHSEWNEIRKARVRKNVMIDDVAKLLRIPYGTAKNWDEGVELPAEWLVRCICKLIADMKMPEVDASQDLKTARIDAGIKMSELTSELGVPLGTYKNWENGSRNCRTFIKKICLAKIEEMKSEGKHRT